MTIGTPRPLTCRLYLPGHTVHCIPALRVANRREVAAASRAGYLLSVGGDTLTVELAGGETVELLNHDTPRLREVWPPLPLLVTWNERYAPLTSPCDSHVFLGPVGRAWPAQLLPTDDQDDPSDAGSCAVW